MGHCVHPDDCWGRKVLCWEAEKAGGVLGWEEDGGGVVQAKKGEGTVEQGLYHTLIPIRKAKKHRATRFCASEAAFADPSSPIELGEKCSLTPRKLPVCSIPALDITWA